MSAPSLKEVIAAILEIEPSQLDDDAGVNVTENWSSLNQFMIMSAVEREFDAKLTFGDMEEVNTLRAIREFLRRQGIAAAD